MSGARAQRARMTGKMRPIPKAYVLVACKAFSFLLLQQMQREVSAVSLMLIPNLPRIKYRTYVVLASLRSASATRLSFKNKVTE